ncbi:hypothetical protein SRHO_G00027940 [Serrasalmus rhombeus]
MRVPGPSGVHSMRVLMQNWRQYTLEVPVIIQHNVHVRLYPTLSTFFDQGLRPSCIQLVRSKRVEKLKPGQALCLEEVYSCFKVKSEESFWAP